MITYRNQKGSRLTSDEVDSNFEYLASISGQASAIIQDNGFEIDSGVFKAVAGTIWNIIGVQYTNPILVEVPIALASTGMQRFYRIVLNTNNTFQLISGDESADYPAIPNKGLDQLDYTVVLVTDSVIGTPTTPLIGDAFAKKIESSTHTFNGSGSLVSIPFLPSGATFIKLTNPGLTSISGFDFTLLTSGSEFPYEGKAIYLQNLTGNAVELKHNDIAGIEFPILLKNEVPINIPNKEIILFRFKNVEVEEVLRSWAAAGSAAFGTLTGSPSDNAALASELSDKADKSDTYTKTEINTKLSAVYVYKGNVANYAALIALTGQEIGWTYNLTDTGDNYAWDGSVWDKLSGVLDISGKLDKVETVDVEKVYIKNADGTQGVKPTSELASFETKNKLITITLADLGVSSIEDVTDLIVSNYINSLDIIAEKGENYHFEIDVPDGGIPIPIPEEFLPDYNKPKNFMPPTAYGFSGEEFRMNPFGVLAKHPLHHNLDIIWNYKNSNELHYSFLPTTESSKSIILKTRDLLGDIINIGTTNLLLTKTTQNPAVSQNFIHIGDSTVDGISASGVNGAIINEVSRRLTGTGTALMTGTENPTTLSLTNIYFRGTLGSSPIKHEGRSGWNAETYLTQSVGNAFWNPSTLEFDLSYYLTNNSFNSGDVTGGVDSTGSNLTILLQLGWNDFYTKTAAEAVVYMKQLIDSIHASKSDTKIKLIGLNNPMYPIRKTYNGTREISVESIMNGIVDYSNAWQEIANDVLYSSFVEFLPVAPFFFPEDSYESELIVKSNRNSNTVKVYTDYVHCNSRGYSQIADIIFQNILYKYCKLT
jgi:lysophospholipase L1-like esterase